MKGIMEVVKNDLKVRADSGEIIDVGKGAQVRYAVNTEVLNHAVKSLKEEGYHVRYFRKNNEEGKPIVIKLLSKKELLSKEVFKNWKGFLKNRMRLASEHERLVNGS